MRFSVLGSGSRGNAVYVESGSTGVLIDAGFSGKEIEKRLKTVDRSLENINALFLTHEHNDHISGAGVLARRCMVPVHANEGTFRGGQAKTGKIPRKKEFGTGDKVVVGELEIRSFRISHDTIDPVGYVVSNGEKKIGYCTDTGKVSHLMARRLADCDGLILEFNHNIEMLKNGPYPLPLQQRVRSSKGHLCNEEAAEFLAALPRDNLQCLVLAHLSEQNNTPELAQKAVWEYVKDLGNVSLYLARQDSALPMTEL